MENNGEQWVVSKIIDVYGHGEKRMQELFSNDKDIINTYLGVCRVNNFDLSVVFVQKKRDCALWGVHNGKWIGAGIKVESRKVAKEREREKWRNQRQLVGDRGGSEHHGGRLKVDGRLWPVRVTRGPPWSTPRAPSCGKLGTLFQSLKDLRKNKCKAILVLPTYLRTGTGDQLKTDALVEIPCKDGPRTDNAIAHFWPSPSRIKRNILLFD
jgi:hypothetical protein